jgi:hypothetical protein
MEQTNGIRNTEISKILIWFGVLVLIISLIDLFGIVFPFNLSEPGWIFSVTQRIITSMVAPILSIVLILCGFYFNKNSLASKKILIIEKFVSLLSLGLAIFLCANLIVYWPSLTPYEIKIVSSIQAQQQTVLRQLDSYKKSPQLNINEDAYKNKINEINQNALNQIKNTKNTLLLNYIKSIIELILYALLSLVLSIVSYRSAKLNSNKLKFAEENIESI